MPPIKTLNRAYKIAAAMEEDSRAIYLPHHVTITITRRMTLMQRIGAWLGMTIRTSRGFIVWTEA